MLTVEIRWDVWERDNFTCQECGVRRCLTIDYIEPQVNGGGDEIENLQTLCGACNSSKGPRDHVAFPTMSVEPVTVEERLQRLGNHTNRVPGECQGDGCSATWTARYRTATLCARCSDKLRKRRYRAGLKGVEY